MFLAMAILVPLAILVLYRLISFSQAAPGATLLLPRQTWNKEPFSALSIEQAFDPDQAVIWETQVPALQLVSSAGRHGLRLEVLKSSYLQSCRRYPELYDGSSFEGWLDFLQRTGLVCVDVDKAMLLAAGQQFLEFRITEGHAIATAVR